MSVRCAHCGHLPHLGRRCRVVRVDGPPSTEGRKVGDFYEHTGTQRNPLHLHYLHS